MEIGIKLLPLVIFFSCTFFGVIISAADQLSGSWPAPDSLLGFWPFDSESGTNDIAHNAAMSSTDRPKLVAEINGPFQKPNTSYSVTDDDYYIGEHYNVPLPPKFTVSFYFYTQAKGNGPIFMFWNLPRFAINYLEPNFLEIWGGPENNGKPIDRSPILAPNRWNYFAITYDSAVRTLTIYNPFGFPRVIHNNVSLPTDPSSMIFVGHTSWGSGEAFMKTTDAIACLMIYDTVLSSDDISKLDHLCFTKGKTTTPRPAIPTTTMAVPVATPTWPMPEALVGFWPFDSESGTNDIAHNAAMSSTNRPKLMKAINGPFAHPSTSYSVTDDDYYIGETYNIPLTQTFTVSFYFYTQAKGNGPIFMFWNLPRFAINYLEPNFLEIWGGPEDGKLIGRFPILAPNSWNFVAMTYDKTITGGALNIYNQCGKVVAFLPNVNLPTDPSSMLFVGHTNWGSGQAFMTTTDAIAGLMLYNTTLTPAQITELPHQCLTKGRANQCT